MASTNIGWVTKILCPLLGVLINNAKGLAPVNALIAARKDKKLGPLSPIPFALITNNCIGWTLYAILNRDYFIFMSNCFSMILGFGLCLTALHILEHTDNGANPIDNIIRLKVEGILMTSSMFWLSIVFITCLVLGDPKYRQLNITIVGSFGNICSLVFYLAPLTNIREIIRKKDSSSLYAPAIVINLVSSILWFFYGLYGISQQIVWIPNTIGVVVCIFELYICWQYPPLPIKAFGGVVLDNYRHNDFAVFASSRHASLSAANFPSMSFSSMSFRNMSFRNINIDDNVKIDQINEKYAGKYSGSPAVTKKVLFPPLSPTSEESFPRTRSGSSTGNNDRIFNSPSLDKDDTSPVDVSNENVATV